MLLVLKSPGSSTYALKAFAAVALSYDVKVTSFQIILGAVMREATMTAALRKPVPTGYGKAYRALVRDPELDLHVKIVAIDLLTYIRKGETKCYPSQGTIAADCGISRGTVNNAVKVLEQLGGLKIIRNPKTNRATAYDLVGLIKLDTSGRLLSDACLGEEHGAKVGDVHAANIHVHPVNNHVHHADITRTDTDKNPLEDASAPPSLSDSDVHSVSEQGVGDILASPFAPDSGNGERQAEHASPPTSGSDAAESGRVSNAPTVADTSTVGTKCNLDRSTVQRLRLAPNGSGYYDDADPEQTIYETLCLVGGEPENSGTLSDYDRERVWFHAKWLARRIAGEYERTGKVVSKPTALFATAVRKDLPIQVDWPEYNYDKHSPEAGFEAEEIHDDLDLLFGTLDAELIERARTIPSNLLTTFYGLSPETRAVFLTASADERERALSAIKARDAA